MSLSSSSSSSSSSTTLCQICKKADFKYICPKCNIPFCSVPCYKNQLHIQCSEEFYRKCVQEEMALRSCPNSIADIPGLNDDIIRMYKTLKRFESRESTNSSIDIDDFDFDEFVEERLKGTHQLDSDDEDEERVDLSTRLEGVDLDDADAIWERLSSKEKTEFQAIIQNGELTQILPAFKPWWTIQEKRKLIEDVCDDSDLNKNVEVKFCQPDVIDKIQPLEKLLTKEPSPCLRNNLINILAAYTCTVRFFNGEHQTSPHETVNYLVTLAATLKKNANFDDEEQAIKSILYEGQTAGLALDSKEYSTIKKDVEQILEGRYCGKTEPIYILAALSDCHRLFVSAKSPRKPKSTPNTSKFFKKFVDTQIANFEDLSRYQLNQLIKKIGFLLSYVDSKR